MSRDPEVYGGYVKANAEPLGRFGAKFLVRGGKHEAVEGKARARNVVIEFPSYQAALDCFRDAEIPGGEGDPRSGDGGRYPRHRGL